MSDAAETKPKYFLLKAMLFPVLVLPVLVMSMLVIRGNESEQLYYRALSAAANRNFEQAAKDFEQASSLGHAESSYNLALLYISGVLESDERIEQGRKYLQRAAFNGSAAAEYELGKLAEDDPEPNYEQAALHYRKAALAGHTDAMVAIGRLHEKGLGVNQSIVLAREFYENAMRNGNAGGSTALALLYYTGAIGAVNHARAEHYLQLAAAQNHARAYTILGYIYDQKDPLPANRSQAAEYYRRAAELNDPEGLVNYGDVLKNSNRIDEALACWIKAADLDFAPALHRLGLYYYRQPQSDFKLARSYFERAAQQGYAASWVNLGIMAEHGQGDKVDLKRALECYRSADKLGHPDGQKLYEKLSGKQ